MEHLQQWITYPFNNNRDSNFPNKMEYMTNISEFEHCDESADMNDEIDNIGVSCVHKEV